MATKILDVDLSVVPYQSYFGLKSYNRVMIVLRWKGKPLGKFWMELNEGRIEGLDILSAATRALDNKIIQECAKELCPSFKGNIKAGNKPSTCSVIVCTHDRPDDLKKCIESLSSLVSQDVEIIVIDNAPSNDQVVGITKNYPVRYVREDHKGLNWARARGAREANGEILIYTDDDIVVEPDWIDAIREPFADRGVAAVTGLVLAKELETEAQEYFEFYFPFGRGFDKKIFDVSNTNPLLPGVIGVGASMAIRRKLVTNLRLFDSEMDCGTATRSGGDTYAFYLLLTHGYRIVYNPEAVSWHRHRREINELRDTLCGYGVGSFVYLIRALLNKRDLGAIYGMFVVWHYWIKCCLLKILAHDSSVPPLIFSLEFIRGGLLSPLAYLASLYREISYNFKVSAKRCAK